jgi:hypothetical protein
MGNMYFIDIKGKSYKLAQMVCLVVSLNVVW